MNRLAPLIVRRPRAIALAATYPDTYAAYRTARADALQMPAVSDDVRLFVTSFLAGLAFFGAYFA